MKNLSMNNQASGNHDISSLDSKKILQSQKRERIGDLEQAICSKVQITLAKFYKPELHIKKLELHIKKLHPQTRVSSLQDSSVWLKKIELLHQSVHFTELENLAQKDENTAIENNYNFSSWKKWYLNDKSRINATSEKGQGQCSFDDLAKFYKLELEDLAQKDENTAIKNNHNFSSWKEWKSRRKRNFSDSSASTGSDFSDLSIPKRAKLASHQNNVNTNILGIDHEVRQKIEDISLAEELPTEMMKKYNEFCSMNSDFETTPPVSPVSNQSGKESPVFNQFGGNELETPSTSYDGQRAAKKSTLFDKFNEDLTCTICYEIFVHPVGLKCGHLFCNFCLIQSMKSKKDCPNCREPIPEKPNKQVQLEDHINNVFSELEDCLKEKREALIKQREEEEKRFANDNQNFNQNANQPEIDDGPIPDQPRNQNLLEGTISYDEEEMEVVSVSLPGFEYPINNPFEREVFNGVLEAYHEYVPESP